MDLKLNLKGKDNSEVFNSVSEARQNELGSLFGSAIKAYYEHKISYQELILAMSSYCQTPEELWLTAECFGAFRSENLDNKSQQVYAVIL